MGIKQLIKRLAAVPFLLIVFAAPLPSSDTQAQESPSPTPTATAGEPQSPPELVFTVPEDGQTVDEPPFVIQMCFVEPVNIRDLPDGGDFSFRLLGPDGRGLGHRDAFQLDGLGVAIYPGEPLGETVGEWTLIWRVTSPNAEEATEGELHYTVDPDGEPAPSATPPPCIGAAGTASPTPAPGTPAGTLSPTEAPTEEPTDEPTAAPTEDGDNGQVDEDDGDDPDILALALLTIGAAGVGAVILLIGFLVRRAIGFDPHKSSGKTDGDEHH